MYLLYNVLLYFLMPFLVLYFTIKEHSKENITFSQRLGFYRPDQLRIAGQTPRIWIHAASVGEVNAIIHFVKLLRRQYPEAWIGVSTMTLSGLEMAQVNLAEADAFFLAPFDLFFTVRRVMRKIRPYLYITVETEIWPNHLQAAKAVGARILMINGRISARTVGTYKAFRSLFQKVLSNYDFFSMIREEDGERIRSFGAAPEKVLVNGNLKFDRILSDVQEEFRLEMAKKLRLSGTEKIWVAGSTKKGEEELLLQAFAQVKREFPHLYLIIAPREIHRGAEIAEIIKGYGYTPLLRTAITETTQVTPDTVIVLNTIGELFKVYSLATLAFCGGSLVPLGGQNPLEPAFWGKPVFYGPSMEDFLDAKGLLEEAGAGLPVQDADELGKGIIALLRDEEALARRGQAGRAMLQKQQGSSERTLMLVNKLLSERVGTQVKAD
ncbi:MAG TPA: 3-deoxy-D-manno-octulosonic acid transferase [Firmicutes bacterium]|nr:3-deoxy-D-manno-octulosonic acid transferase [Bacillota bacterium]